MRSAFQTLLLAAPLLTGCIGLGAAGGERERTPQGAYVAAQPAAPRSYGADPAAPQGVAQGYGTFEVAGMPFEERITGGARADEALPMIIAFHARGGRADTFERVFASFPARARIILPHGGTATGRGGYLWWQPRVGSSDPQEFAGAVRVAEAQVAVAVAELRARRPTLGRPVVCGFSQGGILAFSLAALHPDLVSAAFPFGGLLPIGMAPPPSQTRPYVHAFHGMRDARVSLDRTRASINELRSFGYSAELTEYPALGHELGTEEVQAALAQMAQIVSRPGGP